MKRALRPLRKLYGTTAAAEFGPLALKAVRQHMIDELGSCRRSVNNNINRVRQLFKWGVENELVPASVHHELMAVIGLKVGRSGAVESEPVTRSAARIPCGADGSGTCSPPRRRRTSRSLDPIAASDPARA